MKTLLLIFYIVIAVSISANIFLATVQSTKLKDLKLTKWFGLVAGSLLIGALFPVIAEALLCAGIYRFIKDRSAYMKEAAEEDRRKQEEFDAKCAEMESEEDD